MPQSQFPNRTYVQVCDDRSPDGSNWKTNASQVGMVIRVRAEDVLDAVREILGYSERQVTNPGLSTATATLVRHLPWRCPQAPWLYAMAIPKVQYMGVPMQSPVVPGAGTYAQYNLSADHLAAELTVIFGEPLYDVRDEDQLLAAAAVQATRTGTYDVMEPDGSIESIITVNLYGGDHPAPSGPELEFLRYVEKYENWNVDFLDFGVGTIRYAQGPNVPFVSSPVPFGWKQRLYRTELVWIWRDVPAKGLYDSSGQLNRFIRSTVGKLNNRDWYSYPKGCLLVHPPKITPRVPPVDPSFFGFNVLNGEAGRSYDVEYRLSFFDPPWNLNATPRDNCPTPLAPNYRGWNLLPKRANPGAAFSPYWYLATRSGGLASSAAVVAFGGPPILGGDAGVARTYGGNCMYQYWNLVNLFRLAPN